MNNHTVQLGIWIQSDYGSEPYEDALLSTQTAMPSATAAALMALDAWDGHTPTVDDVYEAAFGRRPDADTEEPAAQIAAWASGSLAAMYPDHAPYRVSADQAARVLRVLGGLDIGDIMAARRLARARLALLDAGLV